MVSKHCWLLVAVALLPPPIWADSCTVAPGTTSRPVLYESEAVDYTRDKYFSALKSSESDWVPETISIPSNPDFTVGSSGESGVTHTTIQEAVNAAINKASSSRQYIRILPGTYREAVIVPETDLKLTLYGSGSSPSDVHIVLKMSAKTTVEEYANLVNPNGERYKSGDPAYSSYNYCASRESTIGTSCSAVFWTKGKNLELSNLTVENESTDGQAVAIYVNADRSHLDNVRLLGYQDTFEAGNQAERIYVTNSYITGDVDFIFGKARLVVEDSEVHVRADRQSGSGYLIAPNTDWNVHYGFLITNCKITSDSAFHQNKKAMLGRSWESGAGSEGYVPGKTPNGQAVIRDSSIDEGFNLSKPWTAMATGRTFTGNTNADRNLDDPNYNRLWEYNNC